MNEASLSIQNGVQRRNVWALHRKKLLWFLVFSTSLDVGLPYSVYRIYGESSMEAFGDPYFGAAAGIFLLLHLAVFLVYSYAAYRYLQPLYLYLLHPQSNPRSEHVEKIRNLVFHLKLVTTGLRMLSRRHRRVVLSLRLNAIVTSNSTWTTRVLHGHRAAF